MSNQLNIEIHGLINFSQAERTKFKKAMATLALVLNSREYYTRFMNLKLEQTGGKSNLELYRMQMSGNNKFQSNNDKDIDIKLTLYRSWKNIIGYTYPSTWFTWINRKFFRKFEDDELCMNVSHEEWHNIGLGHLKASDHFSVPYAGGYLVRDMIRNGFDPAPISLGDVPPTVVQVNQANPDKPVKPTYFIPWYKRFVRWLGF